MHFVIINEQVIPFTRANANKKAPDKMPGAFQFLSTHFTYKSYRFPVRASTVVFLDKNCAFPA
ncbi:hypothetical protein [Dyadobacter sp. 50-39]|uniref:hypothetical protein n=1 Tax=Dyadobacter sp. 50-39 TaxID=1895756 RepID=UPI0025C4C465|nr:hypothetical protein [Dyadobacter sp. 50-39]